MRFYTDSHCCWMFGLFSVMHKPIKKTATSKKPRFESPVFTILFLLLSLAGIPRVARPIEGGYASPTSVAQGMTIDFHISTQSPSYALAIYREGATRKHMMTIPELAGNEYNCADKGYETGCQWPIVYSLQIPTTWPSGVYTGEFSIGANSSDKRYILFVVRQDPPGATSPILVVLPTNTYQAYNYFGGKSLYVSKISGSPNPADQVSYDRPYLWTKGRGEFPWRSQYFIAWAEENGYTLEYATDIDQHRDPQLLGNYSVYVGLGHHEYWSREMRDNLDKFVAAGGNAMHLSGNTSYRQVRFTPDLKTMICYKNNPKKDPYALDNDPLNDYLITTEWFKPPVNYPENSTTGLGWRYGGYHNNSSSNPFQYKDGYGGYRVYRTTDWVFEGTGLANGDMIGRTSGNYAILAFEVDGTLLEAKNAQGALAWDANRFYPAPGALPYVVQTEITKTPGNFTVLGLAPATKGHAVMGYFTSPGGGYVFNAGTTNWVRGLKDDSSVRRITANILDRFASGNSTRSPGN
jgi:N,N-dimethylformamidase beta subunit-like, C-terminal